LIFTISCRERQSDAVTVALSEKFNSLDTLTGTGNTAADDRVRNLIYNSLVRKNEKYEYIGELGDYQIGADNQTVTFILKDNVKFHNGKVLDSADVAYTFGAMLQSTGTKQGSFYDSFPDETDPEKKKTRRVSHFSEPIATPDAKTVVFKVTRPELVNQLLSNLVTIPIIPTGTVEQQKTAPIGTGAFKLVSFDSVNNFVQLEAFPDYWEGAPKIAKLNVKTIPDANALQNELLNGAVDMAPNPTILSPDAIKTLETGALKVERFSGSNIQYIGFNTTAPPLNNVKVRQAIAYAINREKIISELLSGQAKIAYSILPEESWAFTPGVKYNYDPAKAKQLLQEAGYKGEPITFKYAAGNQAVNQYSQVIQNSLKDVGINIQLETLEPQTLITSLINGQFQMNTSTWIGGNQDPIFYRDLFASTDTPERKPIGGRNRARYSNPEFDRVIEEAVRTIDKTKAKELYARAQEIVSTDVPLLPLWYPSSMVISTRRIGNVKINPSGDWSFVKDVAIVE
jgi:peptide/nickel transport system substrate-binding protein